MNYSLPFLAVLIFAGNNVINRLAVGVLAPAEIGFYRWLLAGALLTPFLALPLWRRWHAVRPYFTRILVLGLLGMAVYQSMAYYAATLTTATHMGIILSLMPLMALVLSTLLLGTALTCGAVAGAAIALLGVLIVVSGGDPRVLLHQGINGGDAMMLVATSAYALYGVLFKRWKPPLPPMLLLYLQILVAIVALFPLFLLSPRHGLSLTGAPLILYATLLASLAAPLLWMRGIARLGPERASLFFNLVPLLTALIAAWILDERLTEALFLGGGLTLAGVVIAECWKRPLRDAANSRTASAKA